MIDNTFMRASLKIGMGIKLDTEEIKKLIDLTSETRIVGAQPE